MNDQEKVEYLAGLFRQRQEVEDKIKAVLSGEKIKIVVPLSPSQKAARAQKVKGGGLKSKKR
ncbi:MAG: hypothetical protein PHO56_02160 [Patescibacteria group bacterium]|nr:hypothetical protein [Patescibacteria group bacterium]